ncbi:MAG: hypothetical protein IPM29_18355 [Planctomycetes bacterium]|nr:hypothetical protein [Planctomycetota bacterium]
MLCTPHAFRRSAALLLPLLVWTTGTCPAQDPDTAAERPVQELSNGAIRFQVNPEAGLSVAEFVALASSVTRRPLVFQPAELGSSAPIAFHGELLFERGRDEFFEFFLRTMYEHGIACVPKGQGKSATVDLIAMNGPRRSDILTQAAFVPVERIDDYRGQYGVPIQTVLRLQHINGQIAANATRPFFASTGMSPSSLVLGSVGDDRTILLQGFGPQVANAVQLLKAADVASQTGDSVLRVVRLQHAPAEEIAATLRELTGPQPFNAVSAQGVPVPPPGGARCVAIASLGALVIEGSASDVARVLELVAKLDVPTAQREEEPPAPVEPSALASIATVSVEGDEIRFAIPGGHELPIADFIRMAQRLTGIPFTYSEADIVRGREGLRLMGELRIPRDQFLGFFRTMLYTRGLVVEPASDDATGMHVIRRR